jgi:transposase-like protein
VLSAGLPARPPHCPNPDCDFHACVEGWHFKRKGFFHRQCRPRRIQRYQCQHCGRTFSSQTFSATYWLKRPGFLRTLFFRVVACSGNRQIARELDLAHTTVQRQVERLGRHCLLLHERLRPHGTPREPLVLDGFRSFESGHYWPFDLNHVVGESHFVYAFNEAELRRSGAMRPGQRRHRARLEARHGRPDRRATRRAVEELVGRVVPPAGEVVIRSDQHLDYARAFQRLRTRGRQIRHETTASTAARTSRNPLFPVNLVDLLLRHSGSNHKRETIAFSKRRQGAMYRMAIFVVWRNYVKSVAEQRGDAPPGVALGVIERRLRVEEIVETRLFPSRAGLRGWLARCYEARIPTRCLARGGAPHRRRYAT